MTEAERADQVTTPERRCYYAGCVATWRHWHGFLPGGYDNPDDPEGVPLIFEGDDPEPDAVRDYNGAALPPAHPEHPGEDVVTELPRRMSPRRRTAMANMEQQRDNWIDSAAMYARNADYWRSRAERAERFSLGRAWRLFRRVIRREALVR